MKAAIGILDSGVGGLTVAREAMRQLPNESVIYIGDNARCPYGSRSADEILTYTKELVDFLVAKQIKMLVIACNTATAVTLDYLKTYLNIPVIGVIEPGALAANKSTQNGKIGVIGTKTTINSHSYETLLKQKNPSLSLTSLACPNFVSLVESHQYHTPLTKKVVTQTLAPVKKAQVDTLVLGCTHFPIIASLIQRAMGKDVTLIDSGKETVADVAAILSYENLLADELSEPATHTFYTTGSETLFEEVANEWLDQAIQVEHVDLKTLRGEKHDA